MTPEQIDLVHRSIEELTPRGDELAAAFYRHLFTLDPRARDMFPSDLEVQRAKFFEELRALAAGIADLDAFRQRAGSLGAQHAAFGVRAADYVAGRQAVLAAVAELMGPALTPELERAWNAAYALIAQLMQSAPTPAR